jgi:hypothetical protein
LDGVAGGLDLIDPDSGEVTNIGGFETADSADEGRDTASFSSPIGPPER